MSLQPWLHAFPRAAMLVVLLGILTVLATAIAVGSQSGPATPIGPPQNGLIAYDGTDGDIWVVDPDDAAPRPLTTGPELDTGPTWSPDGSRLAYVAIADLNPPSDSVYDVYTVGAALGSGTGSLAVIDSDGSDRNVLLSDQAIDEGSLLTSWSSDGQRIAFGRLVDGQNECVVVDLGGDESLVVPSCRYPVFSPDDGTIAYQGGTTGLDAGVWLVPSGGPGDSGRRLTTADGSGYAFALPRWSRDGRTILFYAGPDGSHTFWTATVDGEQEQPIARAAGDLAWPAWSPDERRVAWQEQRGGLSDFRLVLADPDGSDLLTLEDIPVGTGAPLTWSPDGTRLVGFGIDPAGTTATSLLLIDPAGLAQTIDIPIESPFWTSGWQSVTS